MTRVHPKYAIGRRLGGGGMAEVFLAQASGAEGFTRWVALKRVLPRLSENAEFARLFISEAQLTSRLQHPNIVSVMDFDRDDRGRLFLVMELVDGRDLDGLSRTGPLGVPLIIYLAIEILSGLRYAHDLPLVTETGVRGIVHRDISPHNVLLSWEGAVKISDFGIAKAREFGHATVTANVRGKPAYMSPEQANGYPLDGRSDLFAVGVMLWEMLCSQPLFRAPTARETIGQMLYGPIPSPRDVRPDVPADVSRVVQKLLVRDREQRTPTADAAITELVACADHPRNGREVLIQTLAERFAGRTPIHAHPIGPSGASPLVETALLARGGSGRVTLTAPPDMVLDPIAPYLPSRRRARRQRQWIVLTSVGIVGGLVGGGLALSIARSDSSSLAPVAPVAPVIDESRTTLDHGHASTPSSGSHPHRPGQKGQGTGSDAVDENRAARPRT